MSDEGIEAKPFKASLIGTDTVCVRNKTGTQITFTIAPEASVDKIVERARLQDQPISFWELLEIMPLASLPSQKHAEASGKTFTDQQPKSRELSNEEAKKVFGVDGMEYDRMEGYARRILYSSFCRRLADPNA